MKPISAIGNKCEHCESRQVLSGGVKGLVQTRYICNLEEQHEDSATYKQACTIYDWAKCPYNEDK